MNHARFGFDYVAGDEPVVGVRDASGVMYKMAEKFSMPAFTDFLAQGWESGTIRQVRRVIF